MKLETAVDSTLLANGIMEEISTVEQIENDYSFELSSADLFRIDCAILSYLRETQDFSRDLLRQLEENSFEKVAVRPPKTIVSEIEAIQQQTIMDITMPLQTMFDDMAEFVTEFMKE